MFFRPLAALLFSTSLVSAICSDTDPYPTTLTITGNVSIHDPAIQQSDDGTYYLFSTHDNISIRKSTSLTGPWARVGSVLAITGSIINNTGSVDPWAPDVHKVGNTYYCYYAVSSFGTQVSSIGVATSRSMQPGTWTDHGVVFSSVVGDLWNAIDPNLLFDKDGTALMSFGSFWSDIFQIPLAKTLLQVAKGEEDVNATAKQISFNSTGSHSEEGAFIYKPQSQPYYYLFFSSGQCCGFNPTNLPAPGEEYKIMVARSLSPRGPFVDKEGLSTTTQNGGTLLLPSHGNIYAPGGQSVFRDKLTGQDVLVYHWIPRDNIDSDDKNKVLGLNYLTWDGNGWPVVI